MVKKVAKCSIIVVVLFFLSTSSIVGASALKDLKSTNWYYENVMVLFNRGIIEGDQYGLFNAEQAITRDQFIKTMVVALGYQYENGEKYWAEPYIDKAIELGIIKIGEFSEYRKAISRGEMAMLAVRAVEALEGVYNYIYVNGEQHKLTDTIADFNSIPEDKKSYIIKSYEQGLIKGYENNSFKSMDFLKRSEACTVIRRVIDKNQRVGFVYDGIEIFNNLNKQDPNKVDFSIRINTLSELEPQYKETQIFLEQITTQDNTNKIIDYVKTKTRGDQILISKNFVWKNGKIIQVGSPGGYTSITIRGY